MRRGVLGASVVIACLAVSVVASVVVGRPVAAVSSTTGSGDWVASGSLAQGWSAPTEAGTERESDLVIAKSPIVGGTSSTSGALPWMTFLLIEKDDGMFQCGGSLIAARWVLTAAHCVHGDVRAIGTITGRTSAPTRSDDPDFVFAKSLLVDSRYQDHLFGVFDMALVELSEASSAQTLPLADPGDARLYASGTPATVAGWGVTAVGADSSAALLTGEVPIRSSADCTAAFAIFDATFNTCAGFSTSEASQPVGSCSGDSGGPLFVATGDARGRVQVGIVSYGRGQCTSLSHPGVYIRVSELYQSIADVVGLPASPTEPPPTEPTPTEPATSYTAVGPIRALDTRADNGTHVPAGTTTTIPVGTRYADTSISVNLTVAAATRPGFATLYACDQKQPATSSLNYQANQPIANGVITEVSAHGTVCVFTNQSAHILLDVFGTFPTPTSFTPVGPIRALDTRADNGTHVPAGTTTTIPVGTRYADTSISVNLTVAAATRPGFATLYACDQKQPATSSLNYQANQPIANGVITEVSAHGTVCVFTNQSAHILLDVFGTFPTPTSFTPVGPIRALDTRADNGTHVPAGTTTTIPVGTRYADTSISVNLTVAAATRPGFATLYACDQKQPATSSLNYQANQPIANGVITEVSAQGTVCVFTNQPAHILLDVFGIVPTDPTS